MNNILLKNLSHYNDLYLYGFNDNEIMQEFVRDHLQKINFALGQMSNVIRYSGKPSEISEILAKDWVKESVIASPGGAKYQYMDYGTLNSNSFSYVSNPIQSFISAVMRIGNPPYIVVVQVKKIAEVDEHFPIERIVKPHKTYRYKPKKKEPMFSIVPLKKTNHTLKDLPQQSKLNYSTMENSVIPIVEAEHENSPTKKGNNTGIYNKYYLFLCDLYTTVQAGNLLNTKKHCKFMNIDSRVINVLLKLNIITVTGRKNNKIYLWTGGKPDQNMTDRVVRLTRASRKKYLKTGKQHVKGYKKGKFTSEEEASFIDMIKQGLSYPTMCKRLNRTRKLLSKHKYRLKIRGVDLNPYPKEEATLFDNVELKPVDVVPKKNNCFLHSNKKNKTREKLLILDDTHKFNKESSLTKHSFKTIKIQNNVKINANHTLEELKVIHYMITEEKVSKEVLRKHVEIRMKLFEKK